MEKISDDLDDFAQKLQEQIFEETRQSYGNPAFERWLKPSYRGTIKNPDGFARLCGKCGDTMEIYLEFEDDFVKNASYTTDGCGSSNVCGSFASEIAIGKTPDEILDITGETIIARFLALPREEEHCAYLAAETLQAALDSYMKKQVKSK